jgi:hypothetical protein
MSRSSRRSRLEGAEATFSRHFGRGGASGVSQLKFHPGFMRKPLIYRHLFCAQMIDSNP